MLKVKFLFVLIGLVVLTSCNPFISKELRKKKRCNDKLEKKMDRLVKKCPNLLKVDTIFETIEVPVPEIRIDTFFQVQVDSSKIDSLVRELSAIEDHDERVRYLTKYVTQAVYVDTSVIIDGVTVGVTMINGKLSISVYKPEEIILIEDMDIIKKISKDPLTLSESLWIGFAKFWWWGIILLIIFFAIRFLYRTFIKK